MGHSGCSVLIAVNTVRKQPYQILVVDDHEAILRHVADWVDATGSAVVTAVATGWGDTVDRIAEHLPDLVLCDVHMPDVDGFELCRRLKQQHPALAVLLFSARDDAALREIALEAGAAGLVSKTASINQLNTAILDAIEGS